MKKFWLFFFSLILACGITLYTKRENLHLLEAEDHSWKTFVRKSGREVASYETTEEEFMKARLPKPKGNFRSPSSIAPNKHFIYRGNRVLIGEVDPQYTDVYTDLPMVNTISPEWKEKMGKDLMRFQDIDTKVLVQNEQSVIKIIEGKGQFLEQVSVTYLLKNGNRNSFRALVDSQTGMVIETWDRTIHERLGKQKKTLAFPSADNSNYFIK